MSEYTEQAEAFVEKHPDFPLVVLNQVGFLGFAALSVAFQRLYNEAEFLGVEGRELALVKTKLQEALAFARTSLARKPNLQGDTVASLAAAHEACANVAQDPPDTQPETPEAKGTEDE